MVLGKEERSSLADRVAREARGCGQWTEWHNGGSMDSEAAVHLLRAEQSLQPVNALLTTTMLLTHSKLFRGLLVELCALLDGQLEVVSSPQTVDRLSRSAPTVETADNHFSQARVVERLHEWLVRLQANAVSCQGMSAAIDAMTNFVQERRPGPVAAPPAPSQFYQQAKHLLKCTSNGHSLDMAILTLTHIVDEAHGDRNLSDYFSGLADFMKRSLADVQFANSAAWYVEVRMRIVQGCYTSDSHGQHLRSFLSATMSWLHNWTDKFEPVNTSDMTCLLVRRMFCHQFGQPAVKPVALTSILFPLVQEMLRSIYIPILSVNDDNVSLVMERFVLQPNESCVGKLVVKGSTKTVGPMHQGIPRESVHVIQITVSGIQAHLKDVCTAYRRNSPPSLSGVVLFDATIGGEGLTVEVLLSAPSEAKYVYSVTAVNTNIPELVLNHVHGLDPTHALYTLLKPVLQFKTSGSLETAVSQAVESKFAELNDYLAQFQDNIVFA